MNVLFINSIHPKKFGGGEKWMVTAAKGLTEAGHNVFLASKRGATILQVAKKAGVQTCVLNIYTDFSPLNTWRIARFLKKQHIQILVCNLNKDVRVAGLAARLVKNPVVIARHGVLLCGEEWKHKVALKRLTDGILTNTETIKEEYLRYGWFDEDFVKVIHNGVADKSHVTPYNFAQRFPGKKVVFSAGRLSKQKGFDYLIEAAALLLKKRSDLVFVVAGKGREEKQLKNLIQKYGIQDAFHFLGFSDDIDPYLKGCDLFVLSSLFEGMPNVIMEAMALGKAVVATDVNGTRELVVHGETGIVVPSRNPARLAEAIAKVMDDPEQRETYGRNGLKRVKAHFTIEKMIQNLEAYFQEKLQKKSKR